MVDNRRFFWTVFGKWVVGIALIPVMGLTACGDGWYGADEEKRLPGKRISILRSEMVARADPTLAEKKILLPKPFRNPAWPQAGGYASHAMHHLALPPELEEVWSRSIGDGSDDDSVLIAAPVVGDGRVYVMDIEGMVTALDAVDGTELWTAETHPDEDADDPVGHGGLALADGLVLAATGWGEVLALDPADGSQRWRQALHSPVHAPLTAAGGRLFVVTINSQLHTLETLTGRQLWAYRGVEDATSLLGNGAPAVSGSTVVAPIGGSDLVALLAENGRQLWSESLQNLRRTGLMGTVADIKGHPVVDRGIVIALSHGARMIAISQNHGMPLWDRDIGSVSAPWVAGDFIFVLNQEGMLLCLQRQDGRIRWLQRLPAYEDSEDRLGRILWVGPVLAGDRLLVANSLGEMASLSPYTGELLGRELFSDPIRLPPVIADETMYLLTDDGELLAFRASASTVSAPVPEMPAVEASAEKRPEGEKAGEKAPGGETVAEKAAAKTSATVEKAPATVEAAANE